MSWRNRVVDHGEADPASLSQNPRNWRRHPEHQRRVLEAVLDEVGFVQDVIVNRVTGHLVDGHLRVEMALKRREKRVPVVYVDLSEEEEALVLATLDPVSALADQDDGALTDLMSLVTTENEDVRALLDGLLEAADPGLLPGESGGTEGSEEGEVEVRDDSILSRISLKMDDPEHQVEPGEVYRAGRVTLVVQDVVKDWEGWVPLLEPGTLFAPYAGPFVAFAVTESPILVVQPDRWIAGHILDKYASIHGEATIELLGRFEEEGILT